MKFLKLLSKAKKYVDIATAYSRKIFTPDKKTEEVKKDDIKKKE